MNRPIVFIDTEANPRSRTCPKCQVKFEIRFPGDRKRFCSRSCSNSVTASGRSGTRNSNWRGGRTAHPLYDSYLDMIGRCYRPTHPRFDDYGGRGIEVCDRWRQDFWAFVSDLGNRPLGRSLDRRDNNAGYSPENCRWATDGEQAANRRPGALAGLDRRRSAIRAELRPRDDQIVSRHRSGESVDALARGFGLSETRIRQVLKASQCKSDTESRAA